MKPINEHKTEAILNKRFSYDEGVMTRREWLNMWRIKGAKVEEKEVPKYEFNRAKYNRLSGNEQEEYERKLSEKKIGYSLRLPDGHTSYDLNKTEYEYFKNMELAEDLNTQKQAMTGEEWEQNEFEFARKYF